MGRNAVICGALHDLFGNLKAHVGVLRNAGVIVGDGHDGHVVFLDQWQHQLEALFFAGHRV